MPSFVVVFRFFIYIIFFCFYFVAHSLLNGFNLLQWKISQDMEIKRKHRWKIFSHNRQIKKKNRKCVRLSHNDVMHFIMDLVCASSILYMFLSLLLIAESDIYTLVDSVLFGGVLVVRWNSFAIWKFNFAYVEMRRNDTRRTPFRMMILIYKFERCIANTHTYNEKNRLNLVSLLVRIHRIKFELNLDAFSILKKM